MELSKICLHILNLDNCSYQQFCAAQPFLHPVPLLFHFTIKWITQYTVLWSCFLYHSVNNYTVKGFLQYSQ